MNKINYPSGASIKDILISALSRTQISPNESLEKLRDALLLKIPFGNEPDAYKHILEIISHLEDVEGVEVFKEKIEIWLETIQLNEEENYTLHIYILLFSLGKISEIETLLDLLSKKNILSEWSKLMIDFLNKALEAIQERYDQNYKSINSLVDTQFTELIALLESKNGIEDSRETSDIIADVKNRVNNLFL